MTYWEKLTEKQLRNAVHHIRAEYTKAWSELEPVISDYFKDFVKRDNFLVDQLEKGLVDLPEGLTAEQYLRKWRLNQLGRGQRWEAVQKVISDRVVQADEAVKDWINGQVIRGAANAFNWRAYTIEAAATRVRLGGMASADVAFNIVKENTIEKLLTGKHIFLPKLTTDEGKTISWCNRKTNSELISAVLSGESTDKLAKRFERITSMSETAAIRNARTALTNAYNAGDQGAAEEAEEQLGVKLQKEWRSTLDDRTRDSHRDMDGERVDIDERFSNGLMYPGDMSTNDPGETYNCRCTYITIVPGLNDGRSVRRGRDGGGTNQLLDRMTYRGKDGSLSYEEWLEARQ